MSMFDKETAIRCFEDALPSKQGGLVANYWLSLWRDNDLPLRADFKPKNIVKELQAIAIFEVVPGESVRCRLYGSGLAKGFGRDITGEDWIALTRPEDRPLRLQRWSDVALGGIGRGLRAGYRESGALQFSEELMLPFGDVSDGRTRQILYHLSWKQTTFDPTRGGVEPATSLSNEFRLYPLQA